MSSRSRDDVLRLLDVANHPTTPSAIRRHLPELKALSANSARRAWERFLETAEEPLKDLPTRDPTQTLYRVQTLASFLLHCTTTEYSELDPESVRRQLEATSAPEKILMRMLDRDGTVFDRWHSWMVAADDSIRTLTGWELSRVLEMKDQNPPFVLCVLSQQPLLHAAVEIREPTGADAAVGGHYYWSGIDLPAGPEYVDLNVRGQAIEEILWRP